MSYVVSEELAGRGEYIKAYSVAVDALERPESFDPSKDPVIRVIATRLRKALVGFYDETPTDVPIKIMLVRGSYRPIFTRLMPSAPVASKPVSDSPAQATPSETRKTLHRYFLAVVVLSALLAVSSLYLIWDLVGHMSEQTDGSAPVIQRSVVPATLALTPSPGCADVRLAETGADCRQTVPEAFRLARTGSISAAE